MCFCWCVRVRVMGVSFWIQSQNIFPYIGRRNAKKESNPTENQDSSCILVLPAFVFVCALLIMT